MTGPRLKRSNRGGGHSYTLDGHKVPGVTTVVGTLDKPALVGWAAEQTAAYGMTHLFSIAAKATSIEELASLDLGRIYEDMKKARFRTTKEAAVRGTRVHSFAEALVEGRDADVPEELAGPVNAVARFLDQWEIESTRKELVVAHGGHRYAGTADLYGTAPKLGSFLLDWKTGKRVYSETALQLAAYRFADLATDGTNDLEVPATDAAYVAHITADAVELLPVHADERVWANFLYLLSLHRLVQGWKEDPAIGNALYPEAVES